MNEDNLIYNSISKKLFKFNTYFSYFKALISLILFAYYFKTKEADSPIDSTENVLKVCYENIIKKQKEYLLNQKGKRILNKLIQKRRKICKVDKYKENLKSLLFHSWVAECELNDPFDIRVNQFFKTDTYNFKYRRMYSNWKAGYIYYSTAKLIEALLFLINDIPFTHDKLKKAFYNDIFINYRDFFYIFPYNTQYDNKGIKIEPLNKEYEKFIINTEIKYENLYKKFLSWTLSNKPFEQIEKWLKNRFNNKWDETYHKEKCKSKKAHSRNLNIKPIRWKKEIKPQPYTFFHCFHDFRVWATYKEVEPFIYGAQSDSKKFILDIAYCWITATFNLMSESIIYNILPNDFIQISKEFSDIIIKGFAPDAEDKFLSPIIIRHKLLEEQYV